MSVCLASFLEGNKDGSLRQMALGAGEVFQNLDFWGAIWCLPPALKRRLVEVGADVVIIGYNINKQTKKLEMGKKYIFGVTSSKDYLTLTLHARSPASLILIMYVFCYFNLYLCICMRILARFRGASASVVENRKDETNGRKSCQLNKNKKDTKIGRKLKSGSDVCTLQAQQYFHQSRKAPNSYECNYHQAG